MEEIIRDINVNELLEGKVFDSDELIISVDGTRMETVHKSDEFEEIDCFVYDIRAEERSVYYNGGSIVAPDEPEYDMYRRKLTEAGIWA